MSVGNLKTDGQKGNNFPWQLRMLKGLQGIINAILAIPAPTPLPTPQIRTPHTYTTTTSGAIPANPNYGFSIANVGAANGTVDGATLKPGYTVSFSPTYNDYLNSMNFDATGTEFLITYID
jgi:hypothetical protein